MRRNDREVKDINDILDIISRSEVCRIGFGGDIPYIVPLSFGESYENGVLTLYFHGAREGEKLQRIFKMPPVCFEMDIPGGIRRGKEPCSCTVSFESVIGTGRAEIVTDINEKIRGLSLIMSHYGYKNVSDFGEAAVAAVCVFKITADMFTAKRHD